MKTLSVKQPWAYLICAGSKDLENRTWKTNFRGRILIHSSGFNKLPLCDLLTDEQFKSFRVDARSCRKLFLRGAIIGSVEIVSCISEKTDGIGRGSKSIWAEEGLYHWILRNPVLFAKSIPAKGKLSLWDYPMTEEEYLNLEKISL